MELRLRLGGEARWLDVLLGCAHVTARLFPSGGLPGSLDPAQPRDPGLGVDLTADQSGETAQRLGRSTLRRGRGSEQWNCVEPLRGLSDQTWNLTRRRTLAQ